MLVSDQEGVQDRCVRADRYRDTFAHTKQHPPWTGRRGALWTWGEDSRCPQRQRARAETPALFLLQDYRGASLTKNTPLLGPCSRTMFLMSVLVRALMFCGECPSVVLDRRRAKFGGDWLIGSVKLRKISTIKIRVFD